MAAISPSPHPFSSFSNTRVSRPNLHSRNASGRAARRVKPHSPLRSFVDLQGFSANALPLQNYSIGDSSEDEGPPSMVAFSAQTRAILEDQPVAGGISIGASVQNDHLPEHAPVAVQKEDKFVADATPSRERFRITRRMTPTPERELHGMRIIRLSPKRVCPDTSKSNRSESQDRTHEILTSSHETSQEYITPAQSVRVKRNPHVRLVESVSSSVRGSGKSSFGSGHLPETEEKDLSEQNGHKENEAKITSGPESTQRIRSRTAADHIPNSMRVKRVPATGSFLRGAPMRRGARRRQSDEEQSPLTDAPDQNPEADLNVLNDGDRQRTRNTDVVWRDFAANNISASSNVSPDLHFHGGLGDQGTKSAHNQHEQLLHDQSSEPAEALLNPQGKSSRTQEKDPGSDRRSLQPANGLYDQENIPPPTFKRNKPVPGMLGDRIALLNHDNMGQMLGNSPGSMDRPVLASLNKNIPAVASQVPPPKMSVLEVATTNAGASTVKSKKKRSHVTVNGKVFSLRGRLGKGGSSDVFRVMAENDKIFALKKVNLEDCNEETVRGFKGEIDLLKLLENDDRVVRLFDWEVNEHKQTLSVLMEIGESDLNRVLGSRIHPDDARLDLSFTRFYWREMLECVAAVHARDIVHSDLKPANFLLVQGRLKLIDFGIANAIDTDNTVNVHRDTNVGTPNYMSPESLQDSKDGKRPPGAPKLMKLGKPSDVWSLGCILYQMTYGKPPFAHIPNQWNRVMAIVNPEVEIHFPPVGVGGVKVPSSLRSLLKRCLDRDFNLRPTIAQMLDRHEPFLNPDTLQEGRVPMTEDMLAQILRNVVNRCKDPKRGIPSEAELRAYPKGFLDRIRASLEKS